MCVCGGCMWKQVPVEARGTEFLEGRVTGGWELCGSWEPSSGSLEEQSALNLSNPQAKILKNYFFIFQDYNIIIYFFFSFSFLQTLPYNPPCKIVTYIYMYIFIGQTTSMVHIELHNFNEQHQVYNCLIFPTMLLLVKSRVYFQSASSGGSPCPSEYGQWRQYMSDDRCTGGSRSMWVEVQGSRLDHLGSA